MHACVCVCVCVCVRTCAGGGGGLLLHLQSPVWSVINNDCDPLTLLYNPLIETSAAKFTC